MAKEKICVLRFIEKKIRKEISEYKFLFDIIEDDFERENLLVEFEWYVRKAVKFKYRYYILSMISFLCPIISEILICVPNEPLIVKIITGIMLGGASFAAALLAMTDAKNKWNMYRSEAETIKRTLREYYREGDAGKRKKLLESLENSYSKTHEKWMKYFQEKENSE